MNIKQKRSKPKQQVSADTRAALDAADAALAAAWVAMEQAGDRMLANGDGDLAALQNAVGMMLRARTELNA